jgi:cytochrome c553
MRLVDAARRWRAPVVLAGVALALAGCGPKTPTVPTPAFPGDPAKGKMLVVSTCGACHGVDGNGVSEAVPRLAGQYPEYIEKQLLAFRADGQAAPKRLSEVMGPIAAKLSKSEVDNVAAYYAGLTPATGAAADPSVLALGQRIYQEGDPDADLPACVSCHRPTGGGIRPDFPRIGGQKAAYMEGQLTHWMSTRAHPGKLMSMIVPHLQPDARHAVANYIAQLAPDPTAAKSAP